MGIKVSKKSQLKGHSGSVYALSKGRNENLFFSGSSDNLIAEWDFNKNESQPFSIKTDAPIYSLVYIPEKEILLAGNGNGGIHIISIKEKKEIKLLQNHTAPVFDIQYDITLNNFFTAGSDGCISINLLEDFTCKKIIPVSNYKVRNIAISPDKTIMAAAVGDCTIRLYETESFNEIKQIYAHNMSVNCVCFHPQNKYLLSGGKDGFLNIWSCENFELIKSLPAHNFALYGICFHPSENIFATASRDKSIKIWDAETIEVLAKLDAKKGGHLNSVNRIYWSNYNNYLVSTGDDKTIIIWEVKIL